MGDRSSKEFRKKYIWKRERERETVALGTSVYWLTCIKQKHCQRKIHSPFFISQVRSYGNSGTSSASFHCSMWLASINHPRIRSDMFQTVAAHLNNPVKGIKRLIYLVTINICITPRLAVTSVTQVFAHFNTKSQLKVRYTSIKGIHGSLPPCDARRAQNTSEYYNTAHKKRKSGTQHSMYFRFRYWQNDTLLVPEIM